MELYKNKEWLQQKVNEIGYMNRIGELCGVSGDTILRWMKKFNIEKRNMPSPNRKYFFNENFFEVIDTEEKAYWLGFIMADGCVSSSNKNTTTDRLCINLKEEDIDHLVKFQNSINSFCKIKIKTIENKKRNFISNTACLHISSTKLCSDLESLGICRNKTGKESIPNISKHLIRHFIRGFFDGDGSITNKKSFRICSASRDILESINTFFEAELGITFAIYQDKKSIKPFFTIDSNHSKKNKKALDCIYKDSITYLDRKYNRYNLFYNSPPQE